MPYHGENNKTDQSFILSATHFFLVSNLTRLLMYWAGRSIATINRIISQPRWCERSHQLLNHVKMFCCCLMGDTSTFRQPRSSADLLHIYSGSQKVFSFCLFSRSLTQNHHSLITALSVIRNDGHLNNDSLIFHTVHFKKTFMRRFSPLALIGGIYPIIQSDEYKYTDNK